MRQYIVYFSNLADKQQQLVADGTSSSPTRQQSQRSQRQRVEWCVELQPIAVNSQQNRWSHLLLQKKVAISKTYLNVDQIRSAILIIN